MLNWIHNLFYKHQNHFRQNKLIFSNRFVYIYIFFLVNNLLLTINNNSWWSNKKAVCVFCGLFWVELEATPGPPLLMTLYIITVLFSLQMLPQEPPQNLVSKNWRSRNRWTEHRSECSIRPRPTVRLCASRRANLPGSRCWSWRNRWLNTRTRGTAWGTPCTVWTWWRKRRGSCSTWTSQWATSNCCWSCATSASRTRTSWWSTPRTWIWAGAWCASFLGRGCRKRGTCPGCGGRRTGARPPSSCWRHTITWYPTWRPWSSSSTKSGAWRILYGDSSKARSVLRGCITTVRADVCGGSDGV